MARIFIFAFDLGEASQLRRIRSLRALGHDLRIAGFRRGNQTAQAELEAGYVELGRVGNNRLARRALTLIAALWRFIRQGGGLRGVDVIIARNFDLLLLAWAVRVTCRGRSVRLVYECLDIHGIFTRRDRIGAAMRWAERRLLRRIDLLIISSPGFLSGYFEPIQAYDGPTALIENKMWFDGAVIPRPTQARPVRSDRPLTLGWVGSIRCEPSLALLTATARHLGDRLQIRIHGNVHRHVLTDFDRRIAELGNVTYAGEYRYPEDLAAIYGGCDLVWSQDLWQRGANSDWLLPNRIYEASWFGCPSVAVADTETGRRVVKDGLGFVIERADTAALAHLLNSLDRSHIREVSQAVLDMDNRVFRLTSDDVAQAFATVL
ncbi:MAG: glycosyltransferase [Albidovulum sp.]|uniref:glycosyltransferase n=1 Tax=Albidovulum sp. TaxID=1872424 RepID=UPI003CA4819B